jgi:hypothetical protein
MMATVNLCEACIGQTKWCNITHSAENLRNGQRNCVTFAANGCHNNFILAINQIQPHMDCAFKDFLFDCVQKMTEEADRKKKKDNANGESLTLASEVLTLPSRIGPTVTDAEWIRIHKMVHIPPSETRKVRHLENVDFVQHVDEEETPVVGYRLDEWHFTKLRVSTNTTRRKITEQIHTNLIRRHTY